MEEMSSTEPQGDDSSAAEKKPPVYTCDRCGFKMIERQCKVICPNCGSRFDCSDLNIFFDL
jgi:Zn finger protein HypA/HybF involved in hydrogenase expression